ncbi:pilus assembly protein PilP, partial [Psychrobacter sp.]|uniref:pilus assembly protein PilP n=1 Tax=Psychrobacter sp. TaxID=56811 RepID=UPI0025E475B2
WPFVAKGFVMMMVVFITILVSYTLLINGKLQQIKAEENKQQILQATYQSNQVQVSQLKSELLADDKTEQQLESLARLLPSNETVNLPQLFNELAVNSEAIIEDVKMSPEVKQDFYSELPIRLIVSGNYHQLGHFLQSLSALPRLITTHDFEVKAKQSASSMTAQQAKSPVLRLTLIAKAYRLQADHDPSAKTDNGTKTDNTYNNDVPKTNSESKKLSEAKNLYENNKVLSGFNDNVTKLEKPKSHMRAYQPSSQRSPFSLPNFVMSNLAFAGKSNTDDNQLQIQPVPSPVIQPRHPLSDYQYRGMMASMGNMKYGLVQRPDGLIVSVRVGQSLGQDHIKVIEITPTQINLSERINDPNMGWTKKRLALIAPVSNS